MPLATATRDHDLFGPQARYGERFCLIGGVSFISGMVYLLGRIYRPFCFSVDLNLINNPRYQVMLREENPLHLEEEMDKTFKAGVTLGYRGFQGPSGSWQADNDTRDQILRISRTRARCCSCNNAGVNLENATTPKPHRLPIDYPLAQPRFLSHLKRYREQTIYCSISIRDEAAASS